jgi:hypothetical protein
LDFPYLYIGDSSGGLIIYDISDIAEPIHLSSTNIGRWTYGIEVTGTLAYTANYWDGFSVIDVSDPRDPKILVREFESRPVWDVRLEDNFLYLLRCGRGIAVYDVTNPELPMEISSIDLPDGANGWKPPMDIELVGQYAFVSQGTQGVFIIDVHDFVDMTVVGQLATDGFAWGLDRQGSILYVAQWREGTIAFDISSFLPSMDRCLNYPFLLTLSKPFGQIFGLSITDGLAFAAASSGDLKIIDLYHKGAPKEIGALDVGDPNQSWDVAVYENYVYL